MNFRILLFLLSTTCNALSHQVRESIKKLSPHEVEVTLTFKLAQDEYLYKESLITTVNTPQVTFSPLATSLKAKNIFDETYKKQKEVYTGTVSFKTIVKSAPMLTTPEVVMHTHYLVSSNKKPQEKTVPIPFTATSEQPASQNKEPKPVKSVRSAETLKCEPTEPSLIGNFVSKLLNIISVTVAHARDTLSSLFSQTGSKVIRGFAAFILGLLLSLTPCIYPMIPITIGILQASGSKSASKNFALALSYTLGISTTFAILGLVAALGSCVFGELQGSPFVIIPFAAILILFALTMFDFFQLPIPQWLQPRTKVKGGSYRSAFLFGAISGTVASPCLSPGLVLILNYVANIASTSAFAYVEGFLLLFIFGIGSSLPLLIIGTFSGSLSMLPKAGAWMIEIKKVVGIMLISMALYHLSHLERIVPWYIFIWVVMLTFIVLGIYYFMSLQKYDSKGMRYYKNVMGTILIIVACIVGVKGERAVIEHLFPEETMQAWMHEYDKAVPAALTTNKLLFIDIGATYCAACKALDDQIFKQEKMQESLALFTLLKIEADINIDSYEKVKKLYGEQILGFPTFLIIDPKTTTVIKKWSVEINLLSLDAINDELRKIAQTPVHSEKS